MLDVIHGLIALLLCVIVSVNYGVVLLYWAVSGHSSCVELSRTGQRLLYTTEGVVWCICLVSVCPSSFFKEEWWCNAHMATCELICALKRRSFIITIHPNASRCESDTICLSPELYLFLADYDRRETQDRGHHWHDGQRRCEHVQRGGG